jgi:pimeloyl-ACP methyl ester carboxylesterase
LEIPAEGVALHGEQAGQGAPLVLLHGLTATRRNVVQGSRHLLRHGYRLVAYDARGHGRSAPAPEPTAYEYSDLVGDLDAVLAHLQLERVALAGSSMGAATAAAYALAAPERVRALVQITPGYPGGPRSDDQSWSRLADALEEGIESFVEAAQPPGLPERWRAAVREATRQRMERHAHLDAVADALRVVPRSWAFEGLGRLEELAVPTLVVGSRDEADPLHPLALAEEYARRLPEAELVVEAPGETPLAWSGARLSAAIGDFLERSGAGPQE